MLYLYVKFQIIDAVVQKISPGQIFADKGNTQYIQIETLGANAFSKKFTCSKKSLLLHPIYYVRAF